MKSVSAQKQNQTKEEFDYDQYGFYLPLSQINSQFKQAELKQINARVEKWRKMLPTIDNLIATSNAKLKSRIRKGIPDAIRVKIWPHLAQIDKLKQKYSYNNLIASPHFPYGIDIEADLNRTFPTNILFQNKSKAGIDALRNILKAVSLAHVDMGYCQGLNFVAAAFMIYLNDEESFFLVISLLENYDCEKMYLDVGSIHRQLYVHDQLMRKYMPDVADILKAHSIDSVMYATPWYMTLFSSILPFRYFLRLMDIFFQEQWKIVYRVALTIIKLKRQKLLACTSFEDVYFIMKDFSEYKENSIDEDQFFKIACTNFQFSQKLIDQLEQQYEQSKPPSQNSEKKKKNRPLAEKVESIEKEKEQIQEIQPLDAQIQKIYIDNEQQINIQNKGIKERGINDRHNNNNDHHNNNINNNNSNSNHNNNSNLNNSSEQQGQINNLNGSQLKLQIKQDIKIDQHCLDSDCDLSPSQANENKNPIVIREAPYLSFSQHH